MKLDHLLIPHARISSKWIKDLNGRPETIKIPEENISSKISGIAHRKFLTRYISPGKGNKWDFIKLKRFTHQRKSSTK